MKNFHFEQTNFVRNYEGWIKAVYVNHVFNDSVELIRFDTESESAFFLIQ